MIHKILQTHQYFAEAEEDENIVSWQEKRKTQQDVPIVTKTVCKGCIFCQTFKWIPIFLQL